MKFLFVTLFPEQIEQAASHSILQRAASKGLIEVSCINPRDFTHDVHRTVDDSPFGRRCRYGAEAGADGGCHPQGEGAVAERPCYCDVPGRTHAQTEHC